MTTQEMIDLDDAEIMDLGAASEQTEGTEDKGGEVNQSRS